MSTEFYKAVAKRLVTFFESQNLRRGTRYWLRLDNQEMIAGIDSALQKQLDGTGKKGIYTYKNDSGEVAYDTYSFDLPTKIVFAVQDENMEPDFLATLRNDARRRGFVIACLAKERLDTVDSSTVLLSSRGMPFSSEVIKKDIRKFTSDSTIDPGKRTLLDFAGSKVEEDRFSDRTSLSSFETFLGILEKNRVDEADFLAFRMLPDVDGLKQCKKYKDKKTLIRFENNSNMFEEISAAFDKDSINEDLSDVYQGKLLIELKKKKEEDKTWYEGLTYKGVYENHKDEKGSHKIEIPSGKVTVRSPSVPGIVFHEGVDYFVREEGETKAAKRRRHFLISIPDAVEDIRIDLPTSIPFKKNVDFDKQKSLCCDVAKVSDSKIRIIINDLTEDANFSRAVIGKNRIDIAVVRCPCSFFSAIQTRFLVLPKGTHKSVSLEIPDGRLDINQTGGESVHCTLADGETYTCSESEHLILEASSDVWDEGLPTIRFSVACGGSLIPFTAKGDKRKISARNAASIYKEKVLRRQSFSLTGENGIQLGTKDFTIEDPETLEALRLERSLQEKNWLAADYTNGALRQHELSVPEDAKEAYYELYSKLEAEHTTASLAYPLGPAKPYIEKCIQALKTNFDNVHDGDASSEFEDLLLIGAVFDMDNHAILFSPYAAINLAYQLNLAETGEFQDNDNERLATAAISRLGCQECIPYIRYQEEYYEVSNSLPLPEWTRYYPLNYMLSRGIETSVSRIVTDRLKDYLNHFGFLFDGRRDKELRIAAIDLGTCEGILLGVIEFLIWQTRRQPSFELITKVHVECYGDPKTYTAFETLLNEDAIRSFLDANGIFEEVKAQKPQPLQAYECIMLVLDKVSFSLHAYSEQGKVAPAHIAFVQGASKQEPQPNADTTEMHSGQLLDGVLNVSATTNQGNYFKTGFGEKFAPDGPFNDFVRRYNALWACSFTASPYDAHNAIYTSISRKQESTYSNYYDAADWVVLLDPKVDPTHFMADDGSKDLLIIHYTDQESANGYDAITVTKKSKQYESVIEDALGDASNGNVSKHVREVINFANAFNGTWLLSFLGGTESQLPRSRMSMLAAVKAALAYYDNEEICWIPVSLEEILRISAGLKLNASEEINSYKTLGFKREPTSDDILLVGLSGDQENLRIILHPVEVKVGNCTNDEMEKGVEQAQSTYRKFMDAYWSEETRDQMQTRIARNAFMQHVIIAAEKYLAYSIPGKENWEHASIDLREALQNERYTIETSDAFNMPIGSVFAFSSAVYQATPENKQTDDGVVKIVKVPELEIPDITISEKRENIRRVGKHDFETPTSEASNGGTSNNIEIEQHQEQPESEAESVSSNVDTHDDQGKSFEDSGIKVLFGTDTSNGNPVYWEPCDTSKLFHTNTGIIGTMGTGKTQFTKSMIAQLYRERDKNPGGAPLGILIFDYKGDYNSLQTDFVNATEATVLKPYKLPFNPLAIEKTTNSLPLLPKHVANTFKDTLIRSCSSSKMGAVQENTLFNCIMSAYEKKRINPADPESWSNEPPTFETVYGIYESDEDIKKNDSLASILNKIHEFEIFESNVNNTMSLYDLLQGTVVIDLSGYDPDIQNLVVGITLDLFYSQMQTHGHSEMRGNLRQLSKFILVDEADNFLSQGFPSLKKVLKEGREFGVGTILSTQFLTHFRAKDEDYSKYILTWVVHNVADLDPSDIRFVFNTVAKSEKENYLYGKVKQLKKHYSLLKMGDSPKAIFLKDKPFWQLIEE